jgi:predicted MFS family arabinose efflux permease
MEQTAVRAPDSSALSDRTVLPLISMVIFAVLSQGVFAILPLLVGATVERLGFTAKEAGLIGAADMFGATVSALLISLVLSRGRWKLILLCGLLLLTVADATSALAQHFPALLLCRILAGLGEGAVLTIAYISMGETRNAVRAYGLATAGYVAYSAPVLYLIPSLLNAFGLPGLFCSLAALTALTTLLVKYIPDRARVSGAPSTSKSKTTLSKASVIGLAGVFTYFMAQAGVWAYLDRIGMANHVDTANVGTALAISSVGGFLGALLATWLDSRYGRLKPLLCSTLCTVVSLLLVTGHGTFVVFSVMVSLFNFAWNFSVPYQFGALAQIDPSRRTVALGGAFVNAGEAAGPALAAAMITERSVQNVSWMGLVLSIVSVLLFARILLPIEQPNIVRP